MNSILALDLGTKTGWALWRKGSIIYSGVQDFKVGRFDGGGMRFLKFGRWLDEVTQDCLGLTVFYEEVRSHGPGGVDAAHAYGGFMATLTAWCEKSKRLGPHEVPSSTPYSGIPVGTIKKFATGKGNAGKPEMIKAAVDRGFHPADDNEADAIALLHWALLENGAAVLPTTKPRRMAKTPDQLEDEAFRRGPFNAGGRD